MTRRSKATSVSVCVCEIVPVTAPPSPKWLAIKCTLNTTPIYTVQVPRARACRPCTSMRTRRAPSLTLGCRDILWG